MKVTKPLNLLCIAICAVVLIHPCFSQCGDSCAVCSPFGSSNCISCLGTRYLFNNTCIFLPCPNGTFAFLGPPRTCIQCSGSCLTCNDGFANNCTSCAAPNYLRANNTCGACPAGTFGNNATRTCVNCAATCAACNGPSSTNCTACNDSRFLNPDNSCKTTCPAGTFGVLATHLCQNCNPSCGTCVGTATNCTSCPGPNWIFNATAHTCTQCHASCATCSAAGPTHCLTCAAGTPNFVPANNSCVATCPAGTFNNGSNGCPNCAATCAACNGPSSTNCTACNDSRFLNPDHSCKTTCPAGYQGNSTTHTCVLTGGCHPSCAGCSGPASNQCTSCALAYPIPVGTSCFPQCAGNYVGKQLICNTCNASCNGCTGATVNCISCAVNYVRNTTSGFCQHVRRNRMRNV